MNGDGVVDPTDWFFKNGRAFEGTGGELFASLEAEKIPYDVRVNHPIVGQLNFKSTEFLPKIGASNTNNVQEINVKVIVDGEVVAIDVWLPSAYAAVIAPFTQKIVAEAKDDGGKTTLPDNS